MEKDHLGELEELVLLLIVMLGDEAYGLNIRRALKEQVGRQVTIGAIHGTVNRLERKGYVTSDLGGATDSRGGRRKRLFTTTNSGMKMLYKSRADRVTLWQQIPELVISPSAQK